MISMKINMPTILDCHLQALIFLLMNSYKEVSHWQNDNSNKLVIDKMKNETADFANKKFVKLKPKIHSFLADISEKKAKDVNRNVVGTISHSKYKDALLNNKCIWHSAIRV